MTKKQAQRGIERYVAPTFPDLRVVGDLLVRSRGSVLHGFAFERSQMNKYFFRLLAFAQLLSVPDEGVAFPPFEELGDFSVEDGEAAAFTQAAQAAEAGREFLARVDGCAQILRHLYDLAPPTTGRSRLHEMRAHCLVRANDDDEALRALDLMSQALSPPEYDSDKHLLAQADELRSALRRSHADATALLDRWTAQTAEAIGVAELD